MARKSMGRQKIEMVKMKNNGNLQVTFSKRRSGLVKKASELCTLCGAEVAVIVFSPGGKAFSFGHPDVHAVADRFISRRAAPVCSSGTMQLIEAHRNATVCELNMQYSQVQSQVEMARKRGEELNRERKARRREWWWEAPVEELSTAQLGQLKSALEELQRNVKKEAERVLMEATSSHSQALMIPSTAHHATATASGSNINQPRMVQPLPQPPQAAAVPNYHPMQIQNMQLQPRSAHNYNAYNPAAFPPFF